jgi:hypothetical protein
MKFLFFITFLQVMFFSACGSSTETKCQVSNCHGLKVECDRIEENSLACTAIYEIGDRCRQYVNCIDENNQCQVLTSSKYDNCVACVENCKLNSDIEKLFECESNC